MARRLFFALWPDPAVRRGLVHLQRALPGGRAVHPEDLHATLAFLGPVADDRLACVTAAAAGLRAPPFELRLDRLGYWSRPKIAWCGADQVPEALGGLVRGLWRALEGCGFSPETRPYLPHVTLARKARRIESEPVEPPLRWPVDRFVLVESLPLPEPPRYKVVASWPLRAGVENQ